MKKISVCLIWLGLIALTSGVPLPEESDDKTPELSANTVEEEYQPPEIVEDGEAQPQESLTDGDILLLEWRPIPIRKYKYAILNGETKDVIESGDALLDEITKANYPNVKLALAVVPGDAQFIYLQDIRVISVDAFMHDKYFQEYQDIIFTMHGYTYKVDLWAHFLKYEEAFWPVTIRLSETFQEYIDSPQENSGDNEAVVVPSAK